MHRAGNCVVPGAITQVWRSDDEQRLTDSLRSDVAWIVPVCRLQQEFGFDIHHRGYGTCVIAALGGWSSTTHEDRSLKFMNSRSLLSIRMLFARSRFNGRTLSLSGSPRCDGKVVDMEDIDCNVPYLATLWSDGDC